MVFLFSPLGRALVSIGAVIIIWFAFAQHYKQQGARNVVNRINELAAKQSEKAREDRAAVPRDGNVEWLQRYHCRDC